MFNAVHVTETIDEATRQDDKWGDQIGLPDGTGSRGQVQREGVAKHACQKAVKEKRVTWAHVLGEECAEALACTDEGHLRQELIQVAAVALQWVSAIDRRAK